MRKAMKNTIFGTALVALLLGAGTAANAQRPGFDGRGGYERGYERGYDHPIAREGFDGRFGHDRLVRPVGPAYPVGPRVGFGVSVGAAPVYDGYADTYIPPCPGDGYEWVAGYYDGGVYVPGAWRVRAGFVGRPYGFHGGFAHPIARGFYGRR